MYWSTRNIEITSLIYMIRYNVSFILNYIQKMSDYGTWVTPRWRPPRNKLLIQRDLISWRLLHEWYSYRRRMQYRTRRSMISFVSPCKFLSGHISLVIFLFLSAPFRKIKKEIIFLLMAWRNLWPLALIEITFDMSLDL